MRRYVERCINFGEGARLVLKRRAMTASKKVPAHGGVRTSEVKGRKKGSLAGSRSSRSQGSMGGASALSISTRRLFRSLWAASRSQNSEGGRRASDGRDSIRLPVAGGAARTTE